MRRAPLGGSGGGVASAWLLPHAEATAALPGAPEAPAEDGGAIAEGWGGWPLGTACVEPLGSERPPGGAHMRLVITAF